MVVLGILMELLDFCSLTVALWEWLAVFDAFFFTNLFSGMGVPFSPAKADCIADTTCVVIS
jgi:hypothetical protein